MALAAGGQILLTRGVFDSARQVLKGEDIPGIGPLSWVSHGPYLLKGIEEAVEVCEVGEAGARAFEPPKTSEKAQRQVRADEEPVLGWRPAVGQAVPNTPWCLEDKLGEGGFGEVWVAQHRQLKERRVFKFCFRADRVRALKRELTDFGIGQVVSAEFLPGVTRAGFTQTMLGSTSSGTGTAMYLAPGPGARGYQVSVCTEAGS
jgi:serine/threonine-protein kinase